MKVDRRIVNVVEALLQEAVEPHEPGFNFSAEEFAERLVAGLETVDPPMAIIDAGPLLKIRELFEIYDKFIKEVLR